MSDAAHNDWLAATGLGLGLGAGDRDLLIRAAVPCRFGRGDVLWLAGSPSKGLFVVLEGRVRVLRTRNGRQHLVHVSEAGATMGEIPLFDRGPYPATAIAATDGRGVFVPSETVRTFVSGDGPWGELFAERLSRRVRKLIERLEGRTMTAVRVRVAASLLGAAASGAQVAVVEGSQEEWAEDLGTVREVLARELKRLKDGGLIGQVAPGRFTILDEVALEALIRGD